MIRCDKRHNKKREYKKFSTQICFCALQLKIPSSHSDKHIALLLMSGLSGRQRLDVPLSIYISNVHVTKQGDLSFGVGRKTIYELFFLQAMCPVCVHACVCVCLLVCLIRP